MILEAVMLQVKQGMEEEYEEAFREASIIHIINERLQNS